MVGHAAEAGHGVGTQETPDEQTPNRRKAHGDRGPSLAPGSWNRWLRALKQCAGCAGCTPVIPAGCKFKARDLGASLRAAWKEQEAGRCLPGGLSAQVGQENHVSRSRGSRLMSSLNLHPRMTPCCGSEQARTFPSGGWSLHYLTCGSPSRENALL